MKLLASALLVALVLSGCALVPANVGTIYELDGQQYLVIEHIDETVDGSQTRTTIDVEAIAIKRADGTWKSLDDVSLYSDLQSEGRYVRGIPDNLITRIPGPSFRISRKFVDGTAASTSDDKMKY